MSIMDDKRLTHNEHAARAMLMGRMYDWRDGTYCMVSGYEIDGTPILHPRNMINCQTFEPVHAVRIGADFIRYRPVDKPIRETPWARMDEDEQ